VETILSDICKYRRMSGLREPVRRASGGGYGSLDMG
jgi:hypothetical protein